MPNSYPMVKYMQIKRLFFVRVFLKFPKIQKANFVRIQFWNLQQLSIYGVPFKGMKRYVKPLITNTSKEFIKCRILHFLIM